MNKAKVLGTSTAVAIALVAAVGCGTSTNNTTGNTAGGTSSGKVKLTETGSSLLYPLFNNQWIQAYESKNPNVTLTAASTGSGQGIQDSTTGVVNIGASDAYLAKAQMQQTPGMLNIPLAISAQEIAYNVPGVSQSTHLKLSGDVLAKIYMGQIKYWDDPAITAMNKGVKLPHHAIVPVRRSDGSGDTFLFTQLLSKTNSAWAKKVMYGTTVSWPSVSGEVGSQGNSGVEASLKSTQYSIGYLGISYQKQANSDGIGYAAVQNKAGNFVLPTATNIQAASKNAPNIPSDERVSLIDMPGANSYPIINFEYAIVKQQQSDATTATALKKFLNWAISSTGGNSSTYLNAVSFQPLPSSVNSLSQTQINKITG